MLYIVCLKRYSLSYERKLVENPLYFHFILLPGKKYYILTSPCHLYNLAYSFPSLSV